MKDNFDQANQYITEAEGMEMTDDQKKMLGELKKVIEQAEAQNKGEIRGKSGRYRRFLHMAFTHFCNLI